MVIIGSCRDKQKLRFWSLDRGILYKKKKTNLWPWFKAYHKEQYDIKAKHPFISWPLNQSAVLLGPRSVAGHWTAPQLQLLFTADNRN